ncbi:D-alanyl-D-alanine carboxypeptidase/D-alanyl-D-alanine-endopeptidase [Maribacter sp. 2-571]|uniref:D-alanyl-D-alanine carboxypeptidase/D-alanyl-D-alanine-endopeptidase n=1 Tax=Maribacter sp. 2-571 TaxID=3417569 RepID=UPI003D33E6B7
MLNALDIDIQALSYFMKFLKKPPFVILFLLMTVSGCGSTKSRKVHRKIHPLLMSEQYQNQFTGLFVIDADTRDTLYNFNGDRYFTPASNTKIATLYSSLRLLPDQMPAMRYSAKSDTLFIQGTGDPTLLHPYFMDSTALRFLQSAEQPYVSLSLDNFYDDRFGPGWAWDDYDYYYHPEKSGFPLYGNVLTLYQRDSLFAIPPYFQDSVVPSKRNRYREEHRNTFYAYGTHGDTLVVPFRADNSSIRSLLEQATEKPVFMGTAPPERAYTILYGTPSDSVYRRMMLKSDNFLAEQLLIMASTTLSDSLSGSIARKHILANGLSDLEQMPRWVDGSGLSRYNLFSPKSLVHILYKLHKEVPQNRLFQFFPAGGSSEGTLKNQFKDTDTPYIYAKSGSLGNNYCLSGYLLTASKKTLIFSFMNNHFRRPVKETKAQMEIVLSALRDTY